MTGEYGVGKIATVQTSKVVSLDHGYKPVKVFQTERPKDAFLQCQRFIGSMDKPPIFHAHQCVTVQCSDFLWEAEKNVLFSLNSVENHFLRKGIENCSLMPPWKRNRNAAEF